MASNTQVTGVCPACGHMSLFVGKGGFVTCSFIGCPDPAAPSKALNANEHAEHKERVAEARERLEATA